MKKLFIAATGQNVGKTTISLGLMLVMIKRGYNIGFIKPMGQRYVVIDGNNVDEDSILMKQVCNINLELKDMSPVAVERGFSEKYVLNPDRKLLEGQVKSAFEKISKDKDIIVIEGTGHSGVGSVFDFSNADMAEFLGAKVLLIAEGGIGNTIDKIMLNKAMYDLRKVEMCGVIVNKTLTDKFEKIRKLLPKALALKGLRDFGILPYRDVLSNPSLEQIKDELKARVLCEGHGLYRPVSKFIVGAMSAHNALSYLTENTVIITPGDRDDIILASLSKYFIKVQQGAESISGIIITGGITPQDTILSLASKTGVPIIQTEYDTYTAASKIHNLIVKIMPYDSAKTAEAARLIEEYVDIERLVDSI